MIELTRAEIEDAFISYKNGDIGLQEVVDIVLLFQSENKVKKDNK